ncbi:hypothetical protein ACFU99_42765, partial [Streptomyces sp. NPDC057654]
GTERMSPAIWRSLSTTAGAAVCGALAEGGVAAYASARRRAAALNRRAAGRALTHLTSPWSRTAQRVAAASAPHSRRAGRWLDAAPYGPRDAGIPGSKY